MIPTSNIIIIEDNDNNNSSADNSSSMLLNDVKEMYKKHVSYKIINWKMSYQNIHVIIDLKDL